MSLLVTAYDYVEFSAEADRQVAERERELRESAERREKKAKKELQKAREKYGDYWSGPYGVLVPVEMPSCIAEDGGNRLSRDGSITLLYVKNPPSQEEWLSKYARLGDDGKYYYKAPTLYMR